MGRIYDGATGDDAVSLDGGGLAVKPIRRGIRRHPSSAADEVEWRDVAEGGVAAGGGCRSSGLVLAPGLVSTRQKRDPGWLAAPAGLRQWQIPRRLAAAPPLQRLALAQRAPGETKPRGMGGGMERSRQWNEQESIDARWRGQLLMADAAPASSQPAGSSVLEQGESSRGEYSGPTAQIVFCWALGSDLPIQVGFKVLFEARHGTEFDRVYRLKAMVTVL
ncbi:hypothetical protein MAPG_09975 [Magnaporthiopsis poae ATCC 64411]|uniref:Uncharacterized protein n=1 Tax=Magnaporthiopsis poae (strain ATCC 64411 / 73-15) TaxID=644358 RepID=A0A0C4EBC7_MAGP6|nr:hypothetical protein MAPG_09975 [Magnaporthiopsis poae ATCC 64411]